MQLFGKIPSLADDVVELWCINVYHISIDINEDRILFLTIGAPMKLMRQQAFGVTGRL